MVQTKFVKLKTLKYFKSITLVLSIAKICENCILELANQSKFVRYKITSYTVFFQTLFIVRPLILHKLTFFSAKICKFTLIILLSLPQN